MEQTNDTLVLNTKLSDIVKSAEEFSDEDVTRLIQMLLNSHKMYLEPRIVINVNKINTNEKESQPTQSA